MGQTLYLHVHVKRTTIEYVGHSVSTLYECGGEGGEEGERRGRRGEKEGGRRGAGGESGGEGW